MELSILNIQGKETGKKIALPDNIFAATPNEHIVYLAVKNYLASQRQGTHKVKTRAEVKGASRKLHKQKGTGGSRKGNIRNPLYKGGGTIFGPKPRDYSFKMNKKEKDLAKISVLSDKAKNNRIIVVDDLKIAKPNTKHVNTAFKNLKINNKKVLVLLEKQDKNSYLSTRNMPNVVCVNMDHMNIFDLVNADILLMTEQAVNIINEQVNKN